MRGAGIHSSCTRFPLQAEAVWRCRRCTQPGRFRWQCPTISPQLRSTWKQFRPCYLRCGQVHYGPHYRASEPVTEIKCTICRTSVRFDLTHIGALPTEDYRIFARHLPCPVSTTDAVSAGLSIIPGLRVSGRQTWRVGPGSRTPTLDNRLIGVLDAQGALSIWAITVRSLDARRLSPSREWVCPISLAAFEHYP